MERHPVILIDTREKNPIQFARFQIKKLNVGDYTTPKHYNKFHLERKSAADLYSTILKGHSRFKKELLRAKENGIELVMIIECTEIRFYEKRFPGSGYCRVQGSILQKIITTIKKRYGLKFIWCTNRKKMKLEILKQLQ